MRSLLVLLAACALVPCTTAYAQGDYIIDSDLSSIRIITDKGGIAAAAAHQHIISIKNISGTVSYAGSGQGTAEFRFAPEQFLVDDEEERKLYPEVFTKPVPEKAIKGTRKNMLGKRLLHATEYPNIEVSIELVSLEGESAVYQTAIKIKDQLIEHTLPGSLVLTEESLQATATFNLSNPELGLKIFSALFGAISVGHDLQFMVDINACKSD